MVGTNLRFAGKMVSLVGLMFALSQCTAHQMRTLNDLQVEMGPGEDGVVVEPMMQLQAEVPVAADGSRGDVSETYKLAAPATVLIRGGDGGFGSGILIHRAGWVLTNHHVVDVAPDKNGHIVVDVEIGRLGASGVMERTNEHAKGWVHKWDAKRDLALLKLEKPPPNLAIVELAESGPVPGQEVSCLGHGNSGLVWSIKPGNVSATGNMTELSKLVGTSCKEAEKANNARRCRYASERANYWKNNTGKVIQSTCHIVGGDSGGPVLGTDSRLIGVNSFTVPSGPDWPPTTYHVHIDEVREFLVDPPEQPLVYKSQAKVQKWSEVKRKVLDMYDVDQDGVFDVLRVQGPKMTDRAGREYSTWAYVADLDQDTTREIKTAAVAQDMWASNFIDYELFVWKRIHGAEVHWLDTDGDGELDAQLNSTNGSTVARARLSDEKRRGEFFGRLLWRPDVFRDRRVAKRYKAMMEGLGGRDISAAEWRGVAHFPHPIGFQDAQFQAYRRLAYGLKVVVAQTKNQNVLMVGLKGKLAKQVVDGSPKKALKARYDFALVQRGVMVWAYYDANGDGRVDLVKMGIRGSKNDHLARWAFRVDRRGRSSYAKDLEGTLLVASSHYKKRATRAQMEGILHRIFGSKE
jgi:S1-C subfamily serine protease